MKKTALVAGGAGFVGCNLCELLLANNTRVICLDNLSTGNMANIKRFDQNSNFKFVHWDVTHPVEIEATEIFNLACPASPKKYQSDPIFTMETNFLGTKNLLSLATSLNVPFLQASTSEIYGDPQIHPQTEAYWGNVNPIGTRSCYDEGKRIAETLCVEYARQFSTDVRIVRIFNTYGPFMSKDDGRVVSNFIVQALNNEDITVYGDGSQTRSFQYINDLTLALLIYIRKESSFLGPMNIGNPEEFTVLELAKKILSLIPESDSKIVHHDLPTDDPLQRKPDITLASHQLSWAPKTDLASGLNNTIKFFRQAL